MSKNSKNSQSSLLSFEVFAMAFALLCFLSFLCLVTGNLLFGDVGEMVRKFFMGALGYLSFIILLLCIYFGIKAVIGFKIQNKTLCRVAKYTAFYAFFVSVLLQTALTSVYGVPFADYLQICYLGGASFASSTLGGVVFGLISWAVCNFLTPVGAYVLYGIALSLTTVILLREKIFNGISLGVRKQKAKSQGSDLIQLKNPNKKAGVGETNNNFNQTQTPTKASGFGFGAMGGEFELKSSKGRKSGGSAQNTQMPFSSQSNFGVNKSYSEPVQPTIDLNNTHSYQSDYDADLQSKIDYVRRPVAPQGISVNSPMGTRDAQSDYQDMSRGSAMDIDLSGVEQQTYVINNGGRSRDSIPAFDRRRGDFEGQQSGADRNNLNGNLSQNDRSRSLGGFGERGGRSNFMGGFEERASFEPDNVQQESLLDNGGYSQTTSRGDRSGFDQAENSRNPFGGRASSFGSASRGDRASFGGESYDSGRGESQERSSFDSEGARRSENLRKLRGERSSRDNLFYQGGSQEQIEERESNSEVLRKLSREGRLGAKNKSSGIGDSSADNSTSGGSDQTTRVYVPKQERESIAPELKKQETVESEERKPEHFAQPTFSEPMQETIKFGDEKPEVKQENKKLKTEDLPKERQLINPIDNIPKNYKYHFPPFNLLKDYIPSEEQVIENKRRQEARKETILTVLAQGNIEAKIEEVKIGPTISRFEISIPQTTFMKKVLERQEDLNLWLEAKDKIRMVAPIPGTSRIGIEVPNSKATLVGLKSVVTSRQFREASMSGLYFPFGKSTIGETVLLDIAEMPHLLVAGSTGTGKSVFLNSLLISLTYKYTPEELRIIIVDPKVVEFTAFMGLPHLMFDDVITDNRKTCAMLEWAVEKMDERYRLLNEHRVKKISEYNELMAKTGGRKMPRMLIIIDEFAEIMSSSAEKKLLENKINRLAAKARAAGIHLILATQRPSADIVEGSIKTNFVSRIAFKMGSSVDAQVIMNEPGSEKLLGKGDAMYRVSGMSNTERAQCAYISEKEIDAVCDYIRSHNRCYYDEFALEQINKNSQEEDTSSAGATVVSEGSAPPKNDDEIIKQAMRVAINENNVSGSMLQRKLGLGYPKAAKIMDILVSRGYVGAPIDSRRREILMDRASFEQTFGESFIKEQ